MSLALPGDVDLFMLVYGGPDGPVAAVCNVLYVIGGGWATTALVPLAMWPPSRRFAFSLGAAVATQAATVWALKLAFGRVRPWVRLGLPPPIGAPRDGSFPSGHAAGSFCVAAFVVLALPVAWPQSPGRLRIVAVTLFVIAALVALSRVYLGAHFPGDVLGGALLGSLVGVGAGSLYVVRERRNRDSAGRGAAG
jgi:membrane-associated phospholipid phosphatase